MRRKEYIEENEDFGSEGEIGKLNEDQEQKTFVIKKHGVKI